MAGGAPAKAEGTAAPGQLARTFNEISRLKPPVRKNIPEPHHCIGSPAQGGQRIRFEIIKPAVGPAAGFFARTF